MIERSFVVIDKSGSEKTNNVLVARQNMGDCENMPISSCNAVSLDNYLLHLGRKDPHLVRRSKIFVVDFSQLPRPPKDKEVKSYLTKLAGLQQSTDIAILLPFHRLQHRAGISSNEGSAEYAATHNDHLSNAKLLMDEVDGRFPRNWKSVVFLEVHIENGTCKAASTETFKDVTTAVLLGGSNREEATGVFKWLLSQDSFLSSPLVTDLPSIPWKFRFRDNCRPSGDNSDTPSSEKRGRDFKPNQRHIDFWTKILKHIFLLRSYSRVATFEKYSNKENYSQMPFVIDFIGGCLDLCFAAYEYGLPYAAEINKNDLLSDRARTVLKRQVTIVMRSIFL